MSRKVQLSYEEELRDCGSRNNSVLKANIDRIDRWSEKLIQIFIEIEKKQTSMTLDVVAAPQVGGGGLSPP